MMGKKVSIVLPVYNGANYVAAAIESVMAQTYQNWELIVVNDCSTDNTLQICQTLAKKDKRIKVISNEQNLKLPNSLNAGFALGTGDYYTWTSHDNLYKPQAIEVLVKVLQEDQTTVMVYGDFIRIDAEGNIISQETLKEPQYLVAGNTCGAYFMYTAEAAKRVGKYDADLFLAEDYDYWVRMCQCGEIKHIPDNLYLYRTHPNSLTETRLMAILEMTYQVMKKNFSTLYMIAKNNHLQREFFDAMISLSDGHREEVKDLFTAVNKKYVFWFMKAEVKRKVKRKSWFCLLNSIRKGIIGK